MSSLLNNRRGRDGEISVALDDPPQTLHGEPELVHVHVCICCGRARKREDISGREIGSGVFHCPMCESDGPLNVEIREV